MKKAQRWRKPKPADQIVQAAEARDILRTDAPESVKLALRLALRGGRQARRKCLDCGRVGISCKVWSDEAVWRVEASAGNSKSCKVYWLCQRHATDYAGGLPSELAAKLR